MFGRCLMFGMDNNNNWIIVYIFFFRVFFCEFGLILLVERNFMWKRVLKCLMKYLVGECWYFVVFWCLGVVLLIFNYSNFGYSVVK